MSICQMYKNSKSFNMIMFVHKFNLTKSVVFDGNQNTIFTIVSNSFL